MDCQFHLQDPTSPHTVYLFEAIIEEAARGPESCTGLFAFASSAGVDSLVGDPEIQDFLGRSTLALLVGIDAVTNPPTLERLQELERRHERLSVRVFRNPTDALFHPKVARFDYADGRRSLIVGSGNLTPGGLRQNFEAFTVVRAAAGETLDVSSWRRFFTDHGADIRAVDDEILQLAARNVLRGRRPHHDIEPEPGATPVREPTDPDIELPVGRADRFLVAQVPGRKPRPGQKPRWRQGQFNREVIDRFFRVRPGTSQRVFLRECRQDGTFAEEKPRRCVYSNVNKNLRIELASHRGAPYPDTGRPIAVFRELQVRSFAYMLLMPGEPGHEGMSRLTDSLESVGRGLPRVIATGADVRAAWPECPLIGIIDARRAGSAEGQRT